MAPVQPAHQRLVRHVVVLRIPLAYFLQGDRHQRTPSGSSRGANRGAADAGCAAIGPAPGGRPRTAFRDPTILLTMSRSACSRARKRSEEHTSELQSLMRISYAVFCLTKKKKNT